ncbi:MAG: RNA methyltransferase [Thermoplasmatota archaeon]
MGEIPIPVRPTVTGEPPVVVLVGTSHPGNAGAAARGAANFGVRDLRFVRPRCDVKGKEAMDRAVHAKEVLREATVYDDLASALQGTALSVGTTARSSPAENHFLRKPLDVRDWMAGQATWSGRAALVFGPEDAGLTREDVNLLDQLVTVPTADYASLNLSHAVTLLCYEHFRLRVSGITAERTLEEGALLSLHRAWDALIDETEGRGWRREVASGVWRKIIGRSHPSTYEVHNIMGILARALKRFGNPAFTREHADRFLRERGLLVPPLPEEADGDE